MKDLGLLEQPQFGLEPRDKDAALLAVLNELTEHHRSCCPEYGRAIERVHGDRWAASSLEAVPWLPVSVFKSKDLRSVPEAEVFKVLKSSGTTSGQTSRIFLDRETATAQTRALAAIMMHFLGGRRMPMLIIDTPDVIRDRTAFSARGAGILGMMNFGRDHCYALRADMSLDRESVEAWLSKHPEEPLFLFGFTFMVWQHFLHELGSLRPDLSRGILVHGGGWKKLVDQSVSNAAFKDALRQRTGLRHVHNFYGMVEQVGSVFMECTEGHLHAPNFAEVIVRDPETWRPAPPGKLGVVQVLSALPRSYPGHSLLTEDLGMIHGADGCACGLRGTHFAILGRIPKSTPRGCSDTLPQST